MKIMQDKKRLFLLGGIGLIGIVLLVISIGTLNPTPPQKANISQKNAAGAQITGQISQVPPRSPTQYQTYLQPTHVPDFVLPTDPTTPTSKPLPGPFHIANGKQNDLTARLFSEHDEAYYEVQLINQRTHEIRIMGYQYYATPGDSIFFSKDYSQVMFIGGTIHNYNQISIYSIPKAKVISEITLDKIKKQLPSLQVDETAVLSRLAPNTNRTKIAFSYGHTYDVTQIAPDTVIVVMNLSTNKMSLLPVRGLVRGWKDDRTIEYEVNSADPNNNTAQETPVTGI